jgi:hypothetical protein
MANYRTGTVSINNASATVTGSGTAWVANARVGQLIQIGQSFTEEIIAVVSDTEITVGSTYEGSNISGEDYQIVPVQGDLVNLVTATNALITQFETIAAEAGDGKFGAGSAAAPGIRFLTDQDTGFFRKAANQIGVSVGGAEAGYFDAADNGLHIDAVVTDLLTAASVAAGAGGFTCAGDVDVSSGLLFCDVSTQNVGIGTTSPRTDLHVAVGTVGRSWSPSAADIIELERGGAGGFNIITSNDGVSFIVFSDADARGRATILYDHDTDEFELKVAGSQALLIDSTRQFGFGTSSPDYLAHINGTLGFAPGASVTPVSNGDVVFELTDNTTLTVKAKGSDGTVRSGTVALS